ncbi:hypothetical protein SAMN02910298_02570 [Pseudobutyrivibrio sp. YE44]|uniref:Mbov_0395 family pilin-like conjugal transfer protein n=1 Tax=Pseudobutyrivibrio sp. YE44 TaxID=1520802 RepID=UPI000887654D|nr:pilin [Pseudobutyrivibrio sp. YE44]SDB50625.1 hypothetical protein SAMN02910298_02570 [Pseudobutyrivibrio sp. YE44]
MSMKNRLHTAKINCLKVGMEVSAVATAIMLNPFSVYAEEVDTSTNVDLTNVTDPIIKLINSILAAAIPLVAAVGALYCVLLGVKYARAEEPQDREKAKQHLKSAIIGFVLIFVLIVALRIATPILTEWMNANS